MTFDTSLIISAIIFSGIGFVYFSYGRKQKDVIIMLIGIALMVYPYFISSLAASICIGITLSLLPFTFGFKWW